LGVHADGAFNDAKREIEEPKKRKKNHETIAITDIGRRFGGRIEHPGAVSPRLAADPLPLHNLG
jgi:hypothetical protein